jgi:2'-5' RNA ligase
VRLFVAIDIDEQTRAQLAPAREAIARVIETAAKPPRVTWLRDDAAHVTLRFIGETADARVAAIQETLAPRVAIAPFEVEWQTLGTFPAGRHPRVVWVGPARGGDALQHLAAAVNERLVAVIGPPEPRPFSPHLTLGRIKQEGRGVDWRRALDAVCWPPTVTTIDHVTLYASRLSPKGATYTAVSQSFLASSASGPR